MKNKLTIESLQEDIDYLLEMNPTGPGTYNSGWKQALDGMQTLIDHYK